MKPLPPKTVLIVLLAVDVMLAFLHVLFSANPITGPLFDLAREANLPTWYSSFKFSLVAAAALFCCYAEKARADSPNAAFGWGWLLVAGLMLALSVDETGQVHETLIAWVMSGKAGNNLRDYFGATETTDSLLWPAVFSPLLILVGVGLMVFYYSRFRLNPAFFRWALVPIVLLGIAGGLEFLEAKTLSTLNAASLWSDYRVLVVAEEMAELFAATLFIHIHYAYAVWRWERGGAFIEPANHVSKQ